MMPDSPAALQGALGVFHCYTACCQAQDIGAVNKEIRCGENHRTRCWHRTIRELRWGMGREKTISDERQCIPARKIRPRFRGHKHTSLSSRAGEAWKVRLPQGIRRVAWQFLY